MKYTLYLDLDGVCADVVRGTFICLGRSLPIAEVRWRFLEQLGLDDSAYWSATTFDFWACLPPTPECFALVDALAGLFGERICIVTTPPPTPGAADGKLAWVRRHLPALADRVFLGRHKHLLAGPGKVLLDDHDDNVAAFREAGGKALTVPRPWNSERGDCDREGGFSIGHLVAALRILTQE